MGKSAMSFVSFGRKTFVMFGAVLGLAALGLFAELTGAQTPTPTAPATARVIRATNAAVQQSAQAQTATVNLQMEALGDETVASFSINFNPAVLSNPVFAAGSGLPAGANLATNTTNAAQGQVGIVVDGTTPFGAGRRNFATVTFTVAPNTQIGQYPVTFGAVPTPQSVASTLGALLPTNFQQGVVQVGTTAAGVQVTGRVLTPEGRGIRNARVVITDPAGNRRTATTSSFGFYSFDEVGAGQGHVVSVQSRKYRFPSRNVQIAEALNDFDFIGQQ